MSRYLKHAYFGSIRIAESIVRVASIAKQGVWRTTLNEVVSMLKFLLSIDCLEVVSPEYTYFNW
jgi:hypothetical protein